MAQEIVEAPMTGKIIRVNIKVGDSVKVDDEMCILESMKMENPIVAPVAGKVAQLGVAADQVIQAGKMIAIIEY